MVFEDVWINECGGGHFRRLLNIKLLCARNENLYQERGPCLLVPKGSSCSLCNHRKGSINELLMEDYE